MLRHLLLLVLVGGVLVVPTGNAAAPTSNVLEWKRIGTSIKGRPIYAFRVGDPEAKVKAVVLGAMHGDELAGIRLARSLKTFRRFEGVDLWVVPTMNPDGVARHRRGNARGVDLNRNWGHRWARLGGKYYSGRKPFSEPETRAMRDFLRKVDPRFVVSFHQPLHGVGRAGERPGFVRRLAREIGLPRKSFNCNGACHGTMTQWFNAHHEGTAVTVEFGYRPSRRYLSGRAMRGTVQAVLGRW